jgi:hypothetical protein
VTITSELLAMLCVYHGHYLIRAEYVQSDRTWEFDINISAEDLAAVEKDMTDENAGVYLTQFAKAMKCVYSRKAESRRQFSRPARQSRW